MALEKTFNLARQDEIPQQFTPAEMTEIKNAISTSTANVNIKPYHVYSPNEQVVGEWQQMIDGVLKKKPVYEKDYYKASVGNGTTIVESNFISGNNVEQLIKLEGNIIATDKSNAWSCNADDEQKKLGIASGDLQLSNTGSSKVWNTAIIVQYTKTTDEWEVVE